MHQHRTLTACLQGSDLRTATFEGREHLVAPVVLLVGDIVISPITAGGASEFVPASVLQSAPGSWSGRPVTAGHPTSSANDPTTLERLAFGRVFNVRFQRGMLVGEVWLDPAQADRVGPAAVSVLSRLRNGQTVEISVGAFVTLEQRQGTASGQRFQSVWVHVAPDHLAALGPSEEGACSVEMGCGAGARMTAAQAAQTPPTADDVLLAIARTQYERESRRIAHAAALAPPPRPYDLALAKRRRSTDRR